MSPAISRRTGSWPEAVTPDEVADRIALTLEGVAEGRLLFRVMADENDALMGWIGLSRPDSAARVASLGYWLGEPFWGRGHATEACRQILALGWAEWDIDVVEADIQLDNAGSLAVVRKLGMTETGERPVYSSARDLHDTCKVFRLDRPAKA